jgi:hypothetical protein
MSFRRGAQHIPRPLHDHLSLFVRPRCPEHALQLGMRRLCLLLRLSVRRHGSTSALTSRRPPRLCRLLQHVIQTLVFEQFFVSRPLGV